MRISLRGLTWRDSITIECFLLWHLLALSNGLFSRNLNIERSSKSAGSLLIHLCSRRNSIDSHEKKLLGLNLSEQMLDVVEDSNKHLLLGHAKGCIVGVFMCTVVDDAIHVQVEAVELWYPILCDQLRDGRVPLAHPSEEFRDTHDWR